MLGTGRDGGSGGGTGSWHDRPANMAAGDGVVSNLTLFDGTVIENYRQGHNGGVFVVVGKNTSQALVVAVPVVLGNPLITAKWVQYPTTHMVVMVGLAAMYPIYLQQPLVIRGSLVVVVAVRQNMAQPQRVRLFMVTVAKAAVVMLAQ